MILAILLILFGLSSPTHEGAARVSLGLLDGTTLDVAINSIRPDGSLFYDAEYPQRISIEDIKSITRNNQPPAGPEHDSAARQIYYLAGGGRLRGTLVDRPDNSDRALRVDAGLPQPLDMRLDALAGIRLAVQEQPEAQRQLDARLADRPVDKDLLLIAQEGKVLVLPGALERITPREWEFKLGKKTQKAPLDAAYAIVLGGPKVQVAGQPALIRFAPDNELVARVLSADGQTLVSDAGPLGRVSIPWASIQTIHLRSERLAWLSSLAPTARQTRSILDVDFPPRVDRAMSGGPLSIRGRVFERGWGVHAYTVLTFKLDGKFERFVATVGIDDAAAPHGSAIFRVKVDGKILHESTVLHGDDPAASISVDVSGGAVLTLECDDAGDLDISDHADWADAALLRARASAIR